MTQAKRRVILFILLLTLGFSAACIHVRDSDPFPNITLPVHPGAINPENKYNAPFKGAKSVVYKIRMPFPAQELTAFYDTELQRMGYERVTENSVFTFQWMNFNYRSGEWEKTTTTPARYTAAWVDHQRTTKIWLFITYKYDGADPEWYVTPIVSVNMSKFDLRNTK